MASDAEKAEAYLNRAAELRAMAKTMTGADSKKLLLSIADDYERLSKVLRQRSEKS